MFYGNTENNFISKIQNTYSPINFLMEDKNFENLLERDEPKSIHGSNITN